MTFGKKICASDIKITDVIVGRWMMIYIIGIAPEADLGRLAREIDHVGLIFRIAAIAVDNDADRAVLLSVVGEDLPQAIASVRANSFYGPLTADAESLRAQLELEQSKRSNRRKAKRKLPSTTTTTTTKRYSATVVLAEEYWEIRFSVGDYETEDDAILAVDTSTAIFLETVEERAPFIAVSGLNFEPLMLKDKDVLIREVSPEVVARLETPLERSNPENRLYIVEDADLVPSALTLADFIEKYGAAYCPDCIGYQIEVSERR